MRKPKDLAGTKQKTGRLVAVSYVRTDPKEGRIWLCKCSCPQGGTREVSAQKFVREQIKRCELCRNGVLVIHQAQVSQATALGIDPIYHDGDFITTWKEKRKEFTREQWHLYHTILYGRSGKVTEVLEPFAYTDNVRNETETGLKWDQVVTEYISEIDSYDLEAEAVYCVLQETDPVWALNFYDEERQEYGEAMTKHLFGEGLKMAA